MNEQELIERTSQVLAESGTPENVEAAGIFNPRGHTGSMFAGGFIGDGIAGAGPDVRILELIHKDTGSSVQLEGNRIPLLHTKDVIKALHGDG